MSAGGGWLTARDLSILQSLDSYRYLDGDQLRALFFPSPRSCRRRLLWLVRHGYLTGWRVVIRPGHRRGHSIYVVSRRAAQALAGNDDADDPAPYIRRSEHALTRHYHLAHDLAANGFFVDLASATRDRADAGLYHWVGPAALRAAYVLDNERGPVADGWGRLLTRRSERLLYLEWDRGTEGAHILRRKVAGYVAHFVDQPGAAFHHVLFVLPTAARETQTRRIGMRELPASSRECCRFWTTTWPLLEGVGPLGLAWLQLGGEPGRVSLPDMTARPAADRVVTDSVGKPGWWERRPGGGQGA